MTRAARYEANTRLARAIARDYFLPDGDRDDVVQEALCALWIATGVYTPERGPFVPFARTVIHRYLQTAIKRANRKGAALLTNAERDHDAATTDPLDEREELRALTRAVAALTDRHRQAVARIVNGIPLQGKADDNARYSARVLLRKALT